MKKSTNNQGMTYTQEIADLMDTNFETVPKVKKNKVSPVQTPLKSSKQTSKLQPSQRTATLTFTDEQKLNILSWYDCNVYKKSKRTVYKDEEGNVCEPKKLFILLKPCRKASKPRSLILDDDEEESEERAKLGFKSKEDEQRNLAIKRRRPSGEKASGN